MSIPVATPRFWWRAPAGQLRAWVSSDPDVDDGGRARWDDRDQQRWALIAEVVADVGDALANGCWESDDENDLYGFVNIDRDSSSLTATELKIVSWFRHAEAVRVDPWFDSLTNGRHRLWTTLPHFAERQVPICSDALGYANPSGAEVLSATWPSLDITHLEQLAAALDWFDDTDPLNRTFVSSVRTAATGVFPPTL